MTTKIPIKNELCNNSFNYFFSLNCQTPDASDGETPGATIVTIDGRVLYRNVPAGEKPSLEPGLYIVNGQKVMIGRRK